MFTYFDHKPDGEIIIGKLKEDGARDFDWSVRISRDKLAGLIMVESDPYEGCCVVHPDNLGDLIKALQILRENTR